MCDGIAKQFSEIHLSNAETTEKYHVFLTVTLEQDSKDKQVAKP